MVNLQLLSIVSDSLGEKVQKKNIEEQQISAKKSQKYVGQNAYFHVLFFGGVFLYFWD